MKHKLIKLPYDIKALEPVISEESIQFHYGKHHQKYVDTLNSLIIDSPYEDMPLTQIIQKADGAIFNNAAQVFNHNFYWLGLNAHKALPSLELFDFIDKSFGSMEAFKEKFISCASKNFGSGWTWLILKNRKLEIINTSNAKTPIQYDIAPLLTCDVWEHAYYIDYRNQRPEYLEKWWNIINWDFVSDNLTKALVDKDKYIKTFD